MKIFKKILISFTFFVLILLGVLFLSTKTASKGDLPIVTKNTTKVENFIIENSIKVKTILEINGEKYENEIEDGVSVYDFMDRFRQEGKITFKEKKYSGMGELIEEINGVRSDGSKNWIYYINGKQAQVGVSNYKINKGDIVSWKYEKDY